MKTLPSFHPDDLIPVMVILTTVLAYLAYWYLSQAKFILKIIEERSTQKSYLLKKVLWQRLSGVFFLGILPGSVLLIFLPFTLKELGLFYQISNETILLTIILIVIVVIINSFAASNPENLKNYPQIRIPGWNLSIVFINMISWSLYLMAYEFLFRGILLFGLIKPFGIWPAIAINVALYSLVHFPKGIRETLGAIPLGFVLSILTVQTGTIWIAIIVHIGMALSNDYFSFKANPEFKFIK
jgi:membrane protease YdiL (CAAX protease family)